MKRFSLSIIIATILTLCCVLSSCAETACAHVFEQKQNVAPTCTVNGTKVLECVYCHKQKTETVTALGHDEEVIKPQKPTCTTDGHTAGKKCARCNEVIVATQVLSATGHDFGSGSDTDFFKALCHNECGQFAMEGNGEFIDSLNYTFNLEGGKSEQDVKDAYDCAMAFLNTVEPYDQNQHAYQPNSALSDESYDFIDNYFTDFKNLDDYLDGQMLIAEIKFYIEFNTDNFGLWQNRLQESSTFYNEYQSMLYAIYAKVYETKYREHFFCAKNGWTQDSINDVIGKALSHANETYLALNNRIDELVNESNSLTREQMKTGDLVPNMYQEYVTKANQLAKLEKDSLGNDLYANYLEYAYKVLRSRTYTTEDSAKMREFVKQISPDIIKHENEKETIIVQNLKTDYYSDEQKETIESFDDNVLAHYQLFESVGDFLKGINDKALGGEIDFHQAANEMFEKSAFIKGEKDIAFSSVVNGYPIIYLGKNSNDVFSFVHEFGHYYNFAYNDWLLLEYDHYETHSQGLESLYLAYLQNVYDSKVYDYLVFNTLYNNIFYMALTSCVDEFEYRVYTKDAEGNPYTASEYDQLFADIMDEYGLTGLANPAYWRYVVMGSTGYYISYAMGLVPTTEIYIDAMTNGLESATEKYLKLITFTNDPNEEFNQPIAFTDVLAYAGLSSQFSDTVYEKFYQYFMNKEIDVTLPTAA